MSNLHWPYLVAVNMSQPKLYPVEEAIKAQKSLREAAGLAPEQFPIEFRCLFKRYLD